MCMMSVSVKLWSISVHNSRICCSSCCFFVVFSWDVDSVRLKMITLLSLFSLSLASRFYSLTWFWMTSLTSLDVILLCVWADVLLSNLAAAISSLTHFSSTLLFNSFSKCATLSSTFFRKISHVSSQLFSFFIFFMTFFTRWAKPMDFCFGCHQFIFFVITANTFYTKMFIAVLTFEQFLVFCLEFLFTGSACPTLFFNYRPFKFCFTFCSRFFPPISCHSW